MGAEPAEDRVRSGLARLIAREAGSSAAIRGPWPLPGGTMRHAWALDVDIPSGPLAGPHRLIYLADRGGVPLPSRLRREDEFRILSVMHAAGVRVPRPYWVAADDPAGPGGGLVLERVEGETRSRRLIHDPAFEAARRGLLDQIGRELARIHAVPLDALASLWPAGSAAGAPADSQLEELESTLRAVEEPHPALELALRWLDGRRPPGSGRVVVHGDYRLGNFVVDRARGLMAVLDWELCHRGDPGEDLGWVCMRFWRCCDRPGARGLGPRQRLLDAYAAERGEPFDPDRLRYWEVLANLRWAIITLTQARRHLSGDERSLELAAIGRHCAEVEWEVLRLLREG